MHYVKQWGQLHTQLLRQAMIPGACLAIVTRRVIQASAGHMGTGVEQQCHTWQPAWCGGEPSRGAAVCARGAGGQPLRAPCEHLRAMSRAYHVIKCHLAHHVIERHLAHHVIERHLAHHVIECHLPHHVIECQTAHTNPLGSAERPAGTWLYWVTSRASAHKQFMSRRAHTGAHWKPCPLA